MSLPLVKYALKAAIRDRLIISLLIVILLGCSLSIFLGSSAALEKDQFTLVFAGAGLRFVSVFGLVLFVVFFIRRSFESKDIEFLLSRPISRLSIILSYSLSFSIMAVVMSLAIALAIFSVSPHLFSFGHVVWIVSIAVENIIMVNTAMFFAMYISSAATASMATFAFYILARMMGQLIGIVDSTLVDSSGPYAMALQLVSVITPRLDLMGQTSWLLYGLDNYAMLYYSVVQGAVFSFLVICAACLDSVRRQF